MNYGLQTLPREIKAYLSGKSPMPWIPYNERGNWESYLPKYEPQAEHFETNGCTVFGALNQIETFYAFLYRHEPNYAERFNFLLTPVDYRRGADPQKVYENIRSGGVVEQRYLPMERTLEDFLDSDDITGSLLAKGLQWRSKHDFKHEWLWDGRPKNWQEILAEGLKTSPIAVSVTAWHKKGGVYVDLERRNNHWCLAYKIDSKGHVWVYDTYDHKKKKLDKDHNIHRAKRIWINKETISALRMHKSLLERVLISLKLKQSLLTACNDAIGTDVTPLDKVPDDVACVDVMTTLLRKVFPDVPYMTGTWTAWRYFEESDKWEKTPDYAPETIVLSPTGTGKGIGHIGVVMEDGTIASNTSFGVNAGRFLKNYTPETWSKRYTEKQGMPIYLFRRKK